MCGGSGLPPATDPKAERDAAAAEATAAANAKAADARRNRQKQSLLAAGAQGNTSAATTSSVLAQGKDKLGS
jgi:hypothetical protein